MKGEVIFEADGRSYTMLFSINAICNLEENLGKTINQISESLQNTETMRMSLARSVFRAGLSDLHPKTTEKQAGEIITNLGFQPAMDLINKAFSLTFPSEEGQENPPKPAADGTGTASSPTG